MNWSSGFRRKCLKIWHQKDKRIKTPKEALVYYPNTCKANCSKAQWGNIWASSPLLLSNKHAHLASGARCLNICLWTSSQGSGLTEHLLLAWAFNCCFPMLSISKSHKLAHLYFVHNWVTYGPRRNKTCLQVLKKRDSNQSPQLQRLARKMKFRL